MRVKDTGREREREREKAKVVPKSVGNEASRSGNSAQHQRHYYYCIIMHSGESMADCMKKTQLGTKPQSISPTSFSFVLSFVSVIFDY